MMPHAIVSIVNGMAIVKKITQMEQHFNTQVKCHFKIYSILVRGR